jgi:predicted deacetylase
MKNTLKIILLTLLILIIILFLIRLTTPREIDDVNPFRNCSSEYLKKAEILWVIPLYNEIPISENQLWCNEILSLNKTLGLHGITHEYHEFENQNINQEQLDNAIKIFQDCFNQNPKIFKAPGLALSKQNRELIKSNNLRIRNKFDQTTHKVYHCSDSGTLPNKFHDLF